MPTVDSKTIEIRFNLKDGNKIIITEKPGKVAFICFVLSIISAVFLTNLGMRIKKVMKKKKKLYH